MKNRLLLLSLLPFPLLLAAQEPTCTIYNYNHTGQSNVEYDDSTHHITGDHAGWLTAQYACTYTGGNGGNQTIPCQAMCTSSGVWGTDPPFESGTLQNPPLPNLHAVHNLQAAGGGASVGAGSGSATCGVLGQVAVRECDYIVDSSCPFTIVVQNTGVGNTGGFSYLPSGATPLWYGANFVDQYTCPGKNEPICVADLDTEPICASGIPTWDTSSCSWYCKSLGSHTPIIIDTDGSGYQLTSAKGGVLFNFYDSKSSVLIAWTASGSTNGFLALPNPDGSITSARQLFSNVSIQPGTPPADNGFTSLSMYDSNQDGKIDAQDGVWNALRIWIDTNHDGKVAPGDANHHGELWSLSEFGILSISLKYTTSDQKDQYGNIFRYQGSMVTEKGKRTIYDVILLSAR